MFLDYISVLYPMLLIFLTWICVESHGRNYRPLVWLWMPLHSCFVWLRWGWNTKNDIIDVFTTCFYLFYSKLMFQAMHFFNKHAIINKYEQCDELFSYFNKYFLLYTVPIVVISFVFIILPPLILILYPFKPFRLCLSKCHSISLLWTHDKLCGCYRNGLDGGQDVRSFSYLYFWQSYYI